LGALHQAMQREPTVIRNRGIEKFALKIPSIASALFDSSSLMPSRPVNSNLTGFLEFLFSDSLDMTRELVKP
jgi:hypothetical protein